jgi:hydroxymethylpyrimidine/phosphomethylpyrimidine kinase
MTPIALTIAGSDSGGGAGIQADLKTFSALGVYGASVVTAITAQNTRGVTAIEQVSPALVGAQLDAVLGDLGVGAIKIGMLFSAPIIWAVAERLTGSMAGGVPVVLDPVMVAKSGDALLQDEAVAALAETLLPRAALLTPNVPEAARLLGVQLARDVAEMARQGAALVARGAGAVLMKGGHGAGATCTDVLVRPGAEPVLLTAERVATPNTHGTGCTLSAAIAAGLAKGLGLEAAVRGAHGYLNAAIRAADRLSVGHGHGPVHHFHGNAAWAP